MKCDCKTNKSSVWNFASFAHLLVSRKTWRERDKNVNIHCVSIQSKNRCSRRIHVEDNCRIATRLPFCHFSFQSRCRFSQTDMWVSLATQFVLELPLNILNAKQIEISCHWIIDLHAISEMEFRLLQCFLLFFFSLCVKRRKTHCQPPTARKINAKHERHRNENKTEDKMEMKSTYAWRKKMKRTEIDARINTKTEMN